jgi:hypothetical protein
MRPRRQHAAAHRHRPGSLQPASALLAVLAQRLSPGVSPSASPSLSRPRRPLQQLLQCGELPIGEVLKRASHCQECEQPSQCEKLPIAKSPRTKRSPLPLPRVGAAPPPPTPHPHTHTHTTTTKSGRAAAALSHLRDDWVDQHHLLVLALGVAALVEHHEPQVHAHLRRRKTDAVVPAAARQGRAGQTLEVGSAAVVRAGRPSGISAATLTGRPGTFHTEKCRKWGLEQGQGMRATLAVVQPRACSPHIPTLKPSIAVALNPVQCAEAMKGEAHHGGPGAACNCNYVLPLLPLLPALPTSMSACKAWL